MAVRRKILMMFKIRQSWLELILKSLKLSWVGDQEKAMVGDGVLIVDFQSSISHFIIFDRKHLSPRKNKNQKAIYLIIRDSNGVFCKLEGLNIKLYKRK